MNHVFQNIWTNKKHSCDHWETGESQLCKRMETRHAYIQPLKSAKDEKRESHFLKYMK